LTEIARAAAQALFLFFPLLVASALAGVVQRFDLLPRLKRPIDACLTFHGRRLFGDSKTWRGVVVAIVGCTATVATQKHASPGIPENLAIMDYGRVNELAFGIAMGAGAMLGELPNSFVKRRLGIAPGATARGPAAAIFYVWDQVDLLTTAWPAVCFWVHPRIIVVLMSFVVALALHPLVSVVGFLIGARRSVR
jgi:hypothetical protein